MFEKDESDNMHSLNIINRTQTKLVIPAVPSLQKMKITDLSSATANVMP